MKALDNAEVHIIRGMVLICFLTHQQVEPQLWCFWRWLRIVELLLISIYDHQQVATVLSWAYGYRLQDIQIGKIDSVYVSTSFESRYGQDILHKNRPDQLRCPPSPLFNEYRGCVISDFRRQSAEDCALRGYYAACSGYFLPTFRRNLSLPSSRFKGFLNPEYVTDKVSRNVGKKLPMHAA